jgi:hypothetical protein
VPAVDVALAIPSTDNMRVTSDIVEVALRVPADQSARMVPRVVELTSSRFGILVPARAGSLCPHLADGGHADEAIPADRLAVTFHHLASVPSPGFAVGGRLSELRFEAGDTGWTSGHGAPVCGDAEAIVLAMAGSTAALPRLDGDGVAVLSERVNQVSRIRVAQRLTKMGRDYLRSAERAASRNSVARVPDDGRWASVGPCRVSAPFIQQVQSAVTPELSKCLEP